jgi:hypothetical protein
MGFLRISIPLRESAVGQSPRTSGRQQGAPV